MPKFRRIDTTWWNVKRPHNSHSTKPDFFQDIIESVSEGPRMELFARRTKTGWDAWGNEIPGSHVLGEESPAQDTKEICRTVGQNSGL